MRSGALTVAWVAIMVFAPVGALAANQGAAPAAAQTASQARGLASGAAGASTTSEVVVTARRLDAARATIQPSVGASTYTIGQQAIQALPAGDDTPLNQVLLQAPGVAQDSFGQLHVRGEHNGLQYRLDGIILPEGLSVFSQTLNPRLAQSVELITGALPAEYGLRTAGIVDIATKSGGFSNGGSMSLYGGSHGDFEPSLEASGSRGNVDYFVSGSYVANDLGIEGPDARADPLHDRTQQFQGFAFVEDVLDPESWLSLIAGSSDQQFQIPDVSGELNGGLGLDVAGRTDYPSQDLNENQAENSQYGVLSYLHTTDRATAQISLYGRYSTLRFLPGVTGDLLYDGISEVADKGDMAGGVQAEGVYHLNGANTLRAGLVVELDRWTSATSSEVLLVDDDPTSPGYGRQVGDQPFAIENGSAATAETYSLYVQDEWKPRDDLTLNYGARFDQFDGFLDQNQLSPRVNLVWQPFTSTTIHAGYARYFTPPPFELVASENVRQFIQPIAGDPAIASTGSPVVAACGALAPTRACPLVARDATPSAERANYFDVGAGQKVTPSLSFTVDSYLKLSRDLLDEGQFGAPIILTPFNYAQGRQYGVELTGSYGKGPLSAYANLAYGVAQGKGWISSQFEFPLAQLDYSAGHWISLDHDQRISASAGASYLWRETRFSADLIYGSGLRQDLPLATPIAEPDESLLTAIPNGAAVQPYAQLNLGLTHTFKDVWGKPLSVRFDVINALDEVYEIRTGTGVGVFAPQYGPRRGFFLGVTKDF